METKMEQTVNMLNKSIYVMLFLSALGIGYSSVKTLMHFEKENWYGSLPLLIISISIFVKNAIELRKLEK